jgi:hypothetical protein
VTVVVDDAILLAILAGGPPPEIAGSPVIRRLDPDARLNLLAAEALAAAYLLEARILVTKNTPLLLEACARTGIDYSLISSH